MGASTSLFRVSSLRAAAAALLLVSPNFARADFASASPATVVAFYSAYSRQIWAVFIPGAYDSAAQTAEMIQDAAARCGCMSATLPQPAVRSKSFSRAFATAPLATVQVRRWGPAPNAHTARARRFDPLVSAALANGPLPAATLIEAPQ